MGPGQSITDETLNKEAVNSIVLKPTTVPLDGLGGVGTVQSSSGPITVLEVGVGELIGIVLSHIWPHVDRDGVLIGNRPSIGPVLPPVEPAYEGQNAMTEVEGKKISLALMRDPSVRCQG